MDNPLWYSPSLSACEIMERKSLLFTEGAIVDHDLLGRLARLDDRFRIYASTYPYGMWGPGLAVSQEMRILTEMYLPMAEIRRAFCRLFALAFRECRSSVAPGFLASPNWLECLSRCEPQFSRVNPAEFLRALMIDEALRLRFIFAVFLPTHYGGRIGRYPAQFHFIRSWLRQNRVRLAKSIQCLDAASGTGEGAYELTRLLIGEGIPMENMTVHGSTLDPVEIFAAAHGFFPHDPVRQKEYREYIRPLFESGVAERLCFFQEDIKKPLPEMSGKYDVILCNGLLGGPLLHDRLTIRHVVGVLAGRLRQGGILLAADRFHEGWKRCVPENMLKELFAGNGLTLLPVGEGVAGLK